jgi:hypothetical protein
VLACPNFFLLAVLSRRANLHWLTCPYPSCPFPSRLSCRVCPIRLSSPPAVLLWLTCPGSHVPADLSRMTCLCSPAPDVLSRLSCSFCPIRLSSPPAVLLWLTCPTCPGGLVSALLPQLSCPDCPFPGVLPWQVFFS